MSRRRLSVLATLVIPLLLAGCLGLNAGEDDPVELENVDDVANKSAQTAWEAYFSAREAGEGPQAPSVEDPGRAGTASVVAVIDMGINPFHEVFQRPGLEDTGTLPVQARETTSGQDPVYLPTHMGPEDPVWVEAVMEAKTLYRFAGTNLLAYQASEGASLIEDDPWGHGTGTAGLVAQTAPNATIVLVQSVSGTQAEAMAWAAEQPWIDVIVTAFNCRLPMTPQGAHVGCPDAATASSDVPTWSEQEVTQASSQAWESGKLVVATGGNSPGYTPLDAMAGPPWVIAVGGADNERNGRTWASSQSVDVLASYVNEAPDGRDGSTEGTREFVGTSGSAPIVAGVLAEGLYQARERVNQTEASRGDSIIDGDGVVATNADVRDAMNRSAEYWAATDYDADALSGARSAEEIGVPIGPAPWVQMGWGYIGPEHAGSIADGLIEGSLEDKPAEAHAWMDARQALRSAMWS